MARIKSAIKRAKQTQSKTMRNKAIKSKVATAIKKFNAAIQANDLTKAQELLKLAHHEIDSSCSAGIVHKNNAARKKGQIAKLYNDLKSGKIVIAVKVDNKEKAAIKKAKEAEVKAAAKKVAEEAKAKKLAEKEAQLKAEKKGVKKEVVKKDEPKEAVKAEKAAPKKAAPKKTEGETEPKAEPKKKAVKKTESAE